MRTLKNGCFLFILMAFSAFTYAQPPATKLNKNRNDKANGLTQRLNKIADTLFLESDKDILRVNFLSHATKEKLQVDVGSPNVNIPLYHFEKGRYTIAVYREDKIIAFDINRIRDILMEDGASTSLEDSMLEASLSDEEKVKRGMKLPPKKKQEVAIKEKPKAKPKKKIAEKKPSQREIKRKLLEEKRAALAEAKKNEKTERDKRLEEAKNRKKTGSSKKMTYNLTKKRNDSLIRQSREEYRRNNLRPNGKPYD